MMPIIQYDQEFENKICKIYKTKLSDEITLKCEYQEYLNIIYENTSLPKELIKLICVWIDDEIILQINMEGPRWLKVASKNSCINFVDMQLSFSSCGDTTYDMYFCNNILLFDESINYIENYVYTRMIYQHTIGTVVGNGLIKNEDNTYAIHFGRCDRLIKIVNNDLLIIVCDIVRNVENYISTLKN